MKFATVWADSSLPTNASMSSINRFLSRRNKYSSDASGHARVMFPHFHTLFTMISSTSSLPPMFLLPALYPYVPMPVSGLPSLSLALSNLKAGYSQCMKLTTRLTSSCIANISERWLSQPKQTSALLRSLFSTGNHKGPTKDESENVGRPYSNLTGPALIFIGQDSQAKASSRRYHILY